MARIMVLSVGSTGDVQPFAALSAGLTARGHEVTFATDAAFAQLAPSGGIAFAPIRADFHSLLPTSKGCRPSMRRQVFPLIAGMLEDSWKVARTARPNLIVAHQKSLAAPHMAEALGISHIQSLTVPMLTPTREFPMPGLIRRDLGPALNRMSYRLVSALTRPYRGLIRDWRAHGLGLGPTDPPPAARTLYCYSPSLVPTPQDWPADSVATGFWFHGRDAGADPVDPRLERFVETGTAPVYIGFGSSVGADPARLGSAVIAAVRQIGVRAVVATGWGGMGDVTGRGSVMVVQAAPHRWLFPRVAAVVHHGGAGTTAAGLLAARPTVICPFQGDQYFWAATVERAGVGPAPLPANKLDADRLGMAIRTAIDDPEIARRAAEMSRQIASEDGIGRAAQEIESVLADNGAPDPARRPCDDHR
jgi:sterol 3beta-glucosyltransferase